MPQPQQQKRHRVQLKDRCMDDRAAKDTAPQKTVLVDSGNLTTALDTVTAGGKKKIEGLYLPSGQRIDGSADATDKVKDEKELKNKEAQLELRLQRVARAKKEQEEKVLKKLRKSGKTEEQYHDDESGQKAKEILAQSTEHDLITYNELFNFFDVDKDRTWGSIEFAQRMTDIGFATSVEDASNLLYFAGVRNVDRITYNDFIQLMPKLKAYRMIIEKDAMAAFQARDPGTGWLTPKLARLVVHDLAGPGGMDNKQVNRLVRKMDRLKDGRITFDFFIRGMFDGTPALVAYVPPKRRHPAIQALLTFLGCGSFSGPSRQVSEPDPSEQ